MNKEFNKLVDQILDFRCKAGPVLATILGIHKYDHKLDKTDQEFRRRYIKKAKEYLKKLEKLSLDVPKGKIRLSANEKIDLIILRNSLEVEIAEEEKIRWFNRLPLIYPQTALRGCNFLILREFAPLSKRMKSVLARLKQVPRLMKEGQGNLRRGKNIPEIWTQIAIDTTVSGKQFLKKKIPHLAERVPQIKKELLRANRKAITAFDEYESFLRKKLLPESRGDFATGKRLFDFLLSVKHQLPYIADDLLAIGNRIIKETQAEMKALAKKIDPTKSWIRVLEDLKRKHPAKENLLEFYKKEVARAKEFVKKKDLVTIPKKESLSVIETPVYNRPSLPLAAYMPPDRSEKRKRGFLWITPVNEKLSPEKQNQQLQGHSVYGAGVTAVHECYPGHHIQLLTSSKIKSKVRRQMGTPLFAEGWALYCEQMMYEQGFFTRPETRLFQLRNQLLRACRVVIDVSLNTKRMSFKQAVNMLVKIAKIDPIRASGEVRFYCYMPTYPMSYTLGKLEILRLREDYKKAKGKAFKLKDFHDKLLSYGSIPVQMIRQRMLEGQK
jgi:uncharacterized protein (DUF885 family)